MTETETRQRLDEPSITCPLCGKAVVQVASATLSLALWQHVHWTCPIWKSQAAQIQHLQEENRTHSYQPQSGPLAELDGADAAIADLSEQLHQVRKENARLTARLQQLETTWRERFNNPTFDAAAWGAFLMCADELKTALPYPPAREGTK